LTVTVPPSAPDGGDRLLITGFTTVRDTFELLVMEFTVTVTGPGPAGAELGTVATICVLLQLEADEARTPLNITVLVPCVLPKFEPAIVTDVPTPPMMGDTLEMYGVVPTVMATLSKVAVSMYPMPPVTAKPM
jgi:hypothetical protein